MTSPLPAAPTINEPVVGATVTTPVRVSGTVPADGVMVFYDDETRITPVGAEVPTTAGEFVADLPLALGPHSLCCTVFVDGVESQWSLVVEFTVA